MRHLEQELSNLLDWICGHWGFCIPAADRIRIAQSKRLEAQEFAVAVLRAEGFIEPETEKKWARLLKGCFVEHFGTDMVSEEQFGAEETA